MELGKKIKVIRPNITSYVLEILMGAFLIVLYFVPQVVRIFKKVQIFQISISSFILGFSVVVLVHGVYHYLNSDNLENIEIYENGLKIGEFESLFNELNIKNNRNKFIFSNKENSKKYNTRLKKDDYKYLRKI